MTKKEALQKNRENGLKHKSNLIPMNKRSPEEQKRIGILAGNATYKKHLIKDTMAEVMALELDSEDKIKAELDRRGIISQTEQVAMCIGMVKTARTNPVAFEKVYTILGQKPVEKVEIGVETKSSEEIMERLFGDWVEIEAEED